jgi:hypothetical protein
MASRFTQPFGTNATSVLGTCQRHLVQHSRGPVPAILRVPSSSLGKVTNYSKFFVVCLRPSKQTSGQQAKFSHCQSPFFQIYYYLIPGSLNTLLAGCKAWPTETRCSVAHGDIPNEKRSCNPFPSKRRRNFENLRAVCSRRHTLHCSERKH